MTGKFCGGIINLLFNGFSYNIPGNFYSLLTFSGAMLEKGTTLLFF